MSRGTKIYYLSRTSTTAFLVISLDKEEEPALGMSEGDAEEHQVVEEGSEPGVERPGRMERLQEDWLDEQLTEQGKGEVQLQLESSEARGGGIGGVQLYLASRDEKKLPPPDP